MPEAISAVSDWTKEKSRRIMADLEEDAWAALASGKFDTFGHFVFCWEALNVTAELELQAPWKFLQEIGRDVEWFRIEGRPRERTRLYKTPLGALRLTFERGDKS